jgi:hypothetical protein
MVNFCTLIPQNLHPKTSDVNAGPTLLQSAGVGLVLTCWLKSVLADKQVRKKGAKFYIGRISSYFYQKKSILYVEKVACIVFLDDPFSIVHKSRTPFATHVTFIFIIFVLRRVKNLLSYTNTT